jgi:hypothetical protein
VCRPLRRASIYGKTDLRQPRAPGRAPGRPLNRPASAARRRRLAASRRSAVLEPA